jgi:hypothetical protein
LSQRPGYINAILIQSRRASCTSDDTCFQCCTNPGQGPFLECRFVNRHFGRCCGNCKWRDYAACCTLTFAQPDSDEGPDSGADDNDNDDCTGNCTRAIKSEANKDGPRLDRKLLLSGVESSGSGSREDPFVL